MSAVEDTSEKWNKAQRLHVAGAVAPYLRDQSNQIKSRRVARLDAEGNVVGYTTLAEVQKALLRTRAIELEVVDGVRPKEVVCRNCGRTVKVNPMGGRLPKVCLDGACIDRRCATAGCNGQITLERARLRATKGLPRGFCRRCAPGESARKAVMSETSAQRSERVRKANASQTARQRSRAKLKAWKTRRAKKRATLTKGKDR